MENQRRITEEVQRKDRFDDIKNEVHTSYKKNIGIDFKWQELLEREDCEQLAAEIEEQKKDCFAILNSKDKLIASFQEQLKLKDEEYVKSLQRQGDAIDSMIDLMRDQYKQLRIEYANELNEIEAEFKRERQEILERNKAEIDALFGKHRQHEEDYIEKRANLEAQQAQELEELRSREANDQQEQKIKLETEMQILEKCMEDMKAVYKLNEEKLEFNLKVLTEREKVNQTALSSLKNKDRKQ